MVIGSAPFIIFLILLYSLLIHTVTSTDIELGSTLEPNNNQNKWNSSKNTFSLGFIPINDSPFFAFGISFSNVLVWKAGDGTTILDSDSRFEFHRNGDLRLINYVSNRLLWQSNTANKGITVATLDESGNLSLKNASNIPVWSTFDNPTNTILPNQYFTTDKILKSGAYSFNLLKSGNLTLSWNTDTVYWNKGLNPSIDTSLIAPYLGLLQTGVFRIFDRTLSSPVTIASTGDYGEGSTDTFRFLRLDSDGNLRIYTSVEGSGIFTQTWAAVQDQCLVYGWCGNMGICSYTESDAVCSCPSMNFEFLDPNDSRKGCKRKVEIENCASNPIMMELENTRFLTYPPELPSQAFTNGIVACKSNCLVDSACDASTSLADGSGLCYMKRSEFISGYHSAALISTSFIKICGPVILNPPRQCAPSSTTFKLRSGVVVAVVFLVSLGCVCIIGVCLWFWRYNNSANYGGHYSLLDYTSGAPIQFSYTDLYRATKRFKDKLGSGGFGSVYKGVLANRTVIAVKRLEGIEQGEKQFRMEVAIISSTHHLNLVRLMGFCSESRHRLLVYEFMKNGSLENSLFNVEDTSKKVLNWETRFNIALGTAKGITYLHEECRDCILHCDIKPENILLDENSNAKVSDFGLAKLINPRDDLYETLTSIRGTRGYLAPEWGANLPITSKSDVYSYGMVLLEVVGGRRNFEVSEETGGLRFSIWAYKEFERGNIFNIIDKRLVEQEVDMEQVMRAIQVSFWCIQEQPSQRPKMGKVVQMLEGITSIETAPSPAVTTEVSIIGPTSTSHASSTGSSAPAPTPSSSSA